MKNVLIFACGILAGAGAGYFAAKTVIQKKNDADLEEVRTYYANEIDILKEKLDSIEKKSEDTAVPETSCKKQKKVNKTEEPVDTAEVEKAEEIIQKMDYNAVSTKPKAKKKAKKDPDIFVIDADEFKELNGYDKMTLTYFDSDDIFLDDTDGEFRDGLEVIGTIDNLVSDDTVVYIRNKLTETDYEIVKESRSYKRYMQEEHGE